MAITYPRQLPFSGSIFGPGSDLSLRRGDARNQDGAGMLEVIELADPLWQLRIVTKPLRPTIRAQWKAFLLSLQGGIQLFYGYHPILQYPIAYGVGVLGLTRNGGGAFDGTATLTAKTSFTLSLSNLPSTYIATPGDMISVPLTTGARMLHVVIEGGTAVAGALTVSVNPAVRTETVATGSTDIRLVKAPALFVVKHETVNAPDGEAFAPVSFEAMQTVRPV